MPLMHDATRPGNNRRLNPATLELMRNRWRGIAEEASAAMIRASFSPNIRERFDCSTAIAKPDGEVIAQAEIGTPLHLGVMPAVIKSVLTEFPIENLGPQDAVITNLPYPEGPGHLPDLSMVSAVWCGGKPVAVIATTAHHVDLGGYAPGSMPFNVSEIYQEGLQIPPTKIFMDGVLNAPVFRLIEQNVRTHREFRGDLMAQWAAANVGATRVNELFVREGGDEVNMYIDGVLQHAERCMRAGIAELKDGVYEYEDFLDDDGMTDEPVRIAVKLTIKGDEATADFSGTSPQVTGPLNARLPAARACVYYVFKSIIDPDLPSCGGAHRPLQVLATPGSLLNAEFPAAIGNANILTDQRVVDVLLGALFQCVPERVCAACSGEMNLINIGGIDSRSNEYFNFVETIGGGQGACHDLDGSDGIQTHLTNTQNTSVELIEQQYPLRVTRYGLIDDSEGAGRYRGGCGIIREFIFLGQRAILSIGADRRRYTPWGLEGGSSARGAHCSITSSDGVEQELPTKVNTTLRYGDKLRIETPGGGGWGDPNQRSRELVKRDLADGLIGKQRALRVYGINPSEAVV
jgi:N-methylhydantoinase B